MTAKSMIILSLLSLSVGATSSFKKCCPSGEVFSGSSKVKCVPTPPQATELYIIDFYNRNVTYGEFPICEKPQDITTVPLFQLNPTDFLQRPSCIEILHEPQTQESFPIYVYCKSNKDRDDRYMYRWQTASLPHILNIKRCCSNNKIFNVSSGECESTFNISDQQYSNADDFLRLLPKEVGNLDFLNVHRGLPECSKAIFTYEIDARDITVVDGILQAKLPGRKYRIPENFNLNELNGCLELIPDYESKQRLVVRVCRDVDYCLDYGCMKKCCAEEESNYDRICRTLHAPNSQLNFYENISKITKKPWNATEYGLLVGLKCPNQMYPQSGNEIYGLTSQGYLQLHPEHGALPYDQFCIDVFSSQKKKLNGLYAFICFNDEVEEPDNTTRYMVSSILVGISCIFLFLTLIVYACLPALQNLHGKTLMCHAASLLMAYACLCIIPWVTPAKKPKEDEYATMCCSVLGFTMLFFFLSAFCWLNVMCFDIWRTFGRLHGNITRGRRHGKRFLLYCLYAWGLSLAITIFGVLADEMHILPEILRPNFGSESCWFDDTLSKQGELIFFRGPIAIQLTSNVVFFILTAEQCSKVKAEIRRVADPLDPRSKRFHADKTKLVMNLKLFIVMGISWITEIFSSFVNRYTNLQYQEELFYASDVLNCLQGLLIFVLFVVKRRVHQALKKRLGFGSKKSSSSQGTSMLHDPYKVKKSVSNTTLTSSFAVPWRLDQTTSNFRE